MSNILIHPRQRELMTNRAEELLELVQIIKREKPWKGRAEYIIKLRQERREILNALK